MKNKFLIIFVVVFFVILSMVVFIFTSPQKPKLEFEKVDTFLGVSEGKIYVTIGDKIISKEISGKSYRVVAADVGGASLDSTNASLFYTQNTDSAKGGVIISLKDGKKTEYPNATEVVWSDTPILKTVTIDKNKLVSTKLVSSSNSAKNIPLYAHDSAVVLGKYVGTLLEVGSEVDDTGVIVVEKHDPVSLEKLGEKDFRSMSEVQNVGDKLIYNRGDLQYQLSDNLVESKIINPKQNKEFLGSPDRELITLDINSVVSVWSLKDNGFEKTGTINANEKDLILVKATKCVYDKNSKKIIFFSGGSIYSLSYGGKV